MFNEKMNRIKRIIDISQEVLGCNVYPGDRKPQAIIEKRINDNELYNVTYTNGALYYEKPINLYLRRQDPFDEYSLIKTNEMPSRMRALLNAGERKDVELLEYQSENYTSC